MKPQHKKDEPSALLQELENLQRVLDDAAGDYSAHHLPGSLLNTLDNIPILDELFTRDDALVLTAVKKSTQSTFSAQPSTAATPAEAAAKVADAPALSPEHKPVSTNPFLPQSILDRLSHERTAAQHSAEEAHRTMQKVTEQKQAHARQTLQEIGVKLSAAEKEVLIDQLVEEILPQLAERLRNKLRQNLN